jgi:TPR repeat protein
MRLPGATYRRKWPSLIFTAVASTCRRTLDRALYHAESAAQSTPSGARQWAEHTLATVYARQGRYADAITWYRSGPKQAAHWLNAAAAQGNEEAKRMLSEQ